VTKADDGVAPAARGATHIGTPAGTGASVGIAELTHDLVRGQLSDYLGDTLGEAARRRVDSHLAVCPPCVAFLDSLRVTVRALGQLPARKAPTGAIARIVEQARREHSDSGADA
jgi:anti-sigma factor RsiW